MAGVGALVSSLINLAASLLPEVKNTFFAASSSSSAQAPDVHALEADLKRLMRMLERIKAALYDAEERNIRDKSIKLWLKELRGVAHEAEYVLDEYMYEVYRAQVEARNASELNLVKGDPEWSVVYSVQIPHGMVDCIRDINSRFEEIAKDREALCLREEDAPRRHCNERKHIPTSPLVVENSIFGREVDKEKVIDLLFSDYNQGKSISVLPIVGKGGLGKTTLAQLVYNDKRVRESFNMSGWVCVSDDFNVERIARHLIESLTRKVCNISNPSFLLEELANIIRGKKIFLVLDDVWNEERGLWDSLYMLLVQAETATILVTTRNILVARIMQTMNPLQLGYLSDDKCWLLFTYYALQGIDSAQRSSLVEIGKEIVKKCGGLPLAVKSIASLLRHEAEVQSWLEILQSELWELDAGNEVLAPLQISYERLPTYLKPCLLLCSMFPKHYTYEMGCMSRLWIANGYIEPKDKKHPEEIAADYAKELHERSFFDDFKSVYSSCYVLNWNPNSVYLDGNFKLHDIVHDLAWLNSEKRCYSVERGISEEIRHLYLNEELMRRPDFLESINISAQQTLVMRHRLFDSNVDMKQISLISHSKTECLRALDLELVHGQTLSLGHLKHLHYLSLFIRGLSEISPEFISSSYSLRMLIIKIEFGPMEMVLEGIGNLINLEFLQLHAKHSRIKLPESMGLLSKLRVLEIHESKLAELPECIGNLTKLHRIVLTYTGLTRLPESFCKLTNLKDLILMKCNELKELPKDFGDLTSLQFWFLQGRRMQYLPLSCKKLLPRCTMHVCNLRTKPENSHGAVGWLKEYNDIKGGLWIRNIGNILSLKDAQNADLFSKYNLETLLLSWQHTWDKAGNALSNGYYECSTDLIPQKGILNISICKSKKHKCLNALNPDRDQRILEIFQPHPYLKHLYIGSYGGEEFPRWMGDPLSCASLVKVYIKRCSRVRFLPFGSVLSLKQLHIDECDRLLYLNKESLPPQLELLIVFQCESLVKVALLQSLIKLRIYSCNALKQLSMEDEQMSKLKSFPLLKEMAVWNCPVIEAKQLLLPEDCDVDIRGCYQNILHNFKYDDSVYLLLRFGGNDDINNNERYDVDSSAYRDDNSDSKDSRSGCGGNNGCGVRGGCNNKGVTTPSADLLHRTVIDLTRTSSDVAPVLAVPPVVQEVENADNMEAGQLQGEDELLDDHDEENEDNILQAALEFESDEFSDEDLLDD